MDYQSFVSGKKFYDNVHFPRGFSRSGIFSVKDAEIIETTGMVVRQLVEGAVQPTDDLQKGLLEVLLSGRAPETPFEKLWNKYFNHIAFKRCPKTLSSSKVSFSSDDGSSSSYYMDD